MNTLSLQRSLLRKEHRNACAGTASVSTAGIAASELGGDTDHHGQHIQGLETTTRTPRNKTKTGAVTAAQLRVFARQNLEPREVQRTSTSRSAQNSCVKNQQLQEACEQVQVWTRKKSATVPRVEINLDDEEQQKEETQRGQQSWLRNQVETSRSSPSLRVASISKQRKVVEEEETSATGTVTRANRPQYYSGREDDDEPRGPRQLRLPLPATTEAPPNSAFKCT